MAIYCIHLLVCVTSKSQILKHIISICRPNEVEKARIAESGAIHNGRLVSGPEMMGEVFFGGALLNMRI